ncbi:uncharacterized protein LOC129246199 [Anastrepha obliqua]|uniref:uncharacterized protein LOC129246199 n=1 Tax=Anastrepha obliqua TaxID=95512 RepID=UPI00240A4FE5|nr:uncharacterized protein LOC129246199 [Anastrepha obliqua]
MLKIFTIVAFCLLATHCEAHWVPQVFTECNSTFVDYQLCQDFRDIRNLIDANTLVYYISYGYFKDESFRKAMDFIGTDQFQSASQQIADSRAYQNILKRFADAGINTESIASIENIFNCVMVSMPKYGDEDEITKLEMGSVVVSRSMVDVATNLMNAIPRAEFRRLIREKLSYNTEFARFYRIVRSSSFKREIRKLFSSYQAKYPLNLLRRKNIDLCKLAQMANQIFEWGPSY